MRYTRQLLCCLIFAAALAQASWAWWSEGHEVIDRAAGSVLPSDMPEFFLKGTDTIASYSMEPDLWTGRDLPALRSSESLNHYLDLELLGGRELPRTRDEFLALCCEIKLPPSSVGALPYTIQEWHDRLAVAFAEHRKWPDDKAVQAKILYIAGVLGHYTGDAGQPLHCTLDYDGRTNPDGSSPRTGIHLKMDALPGQLALNPAEVAKGVKAEAVEDIFARALTAINESHKRVDRVYKLEDKLPPVVGPIEGKPDEDVRRLALDCVRTGAELTATAWHSAWVESLNVAVPEWYRPVAAGSPEGLLE